MTYPLLATLAAYLIGSLSFAVLVSRLMGLNDPRTYGSKNPGATNVLRSGNKAAAVITLLLDAFKGWPAEPEGLNTIEPTLPCHAAGFASLAPTERRYAAPPFCGRRSARRATPPEGRGACVVECRSASTPPGSRRWGLSAWTTG